MFHFPRKNGLLLYVVDTVGISITGLSMPLFIAIQSVMSTVSFELSLKPYMCQKH